MPQASDYKRGMLLVGGVNPALVIAGLGPSGAVVYGGRVSPKPKTLLAEIEARGGAAALGRNCSRGQPGPRTQGQVGGTAAP